MSEIVKALFIPTSVAGVNYWRMFNPCNAAFRTGAFKANMLWWQKDITENHPWQSDIIKESHRPRITGEIDVNAKESDVVVMGMICSQQGLSTMQGIRECYGKPVIMEIDDNMVSVANYNPAAACYVPGSNARKYAVQQMRESDAMVVTTPGLKDAYSEYNDNIYIVPNSIDFEEWNKVQLRREKGKITIGWVGGASHNDDLLILEPAIDYLTTKYPQVQFIFGHGIHPKFREKKSVKWVKEFARIDKYPKYIGKMGFDIGVAPLVDNAFNRGKCVTGNTLVVTNKGLMRIKDISDYRIPDTFQDIKGEPFSHFYYGGKQDIITLKTDMGFEISGTPTHKLKKSTGEWGTLSDLQACDKVQIAPFEYPQTEYQKIKFPLWLTYRVDYKNANYFGSMMPEITINEDWGRFLGYILGDGHLSRTNQLGISCSTDYLDIVEDVKKLYRQLSLNPHEVRKRANGKETKGIDVKASSNHMLAFLRYLGIESRSYLNTKNLCIPSIIWRSPKSVMKEFISALFETDGTVDDVNSRMSFTTKCEGLARDVQFALLGFGIASRISPKFNKIYKKYYYTVILSREFCDIFHRQIGFISKKKSQKLGIIVNKPHSNRYTKFDWVDTVMVKEINQKQDVFDVTIPNIHQYNANGFVSHNSNLRWLEYSALGIPTVASNVGHFAETIHDGSDGMLCDTPDDFIIALESLINDASKRKCMGRDAKERIFKDFNIDNTVKRYATILEEIKNRGQIIRTSPIYKESNFKQSVTAEVFQ